MLTHEQARTWASVDPTMRYTCPAGRCFSSIGPITDCEHTRGQGARVGRGYGDYIVLRDASNCPRGGECPNRGRNTENCPAGAACPVSGHARPGPTHASGTVLVLHDGPREPSPADVAAVRRQVWANQERFCAIDDQIGRVNAGVRSQLAALAAAGVAIPKLLVGQLPDAVEANLDNGSRAALGLPQR